MAEKRFIYNNGFVCDNQTGSCYEMFKNQDGREMADLLNHLHEENIRLRRALQIEFDKDLPSAPVGHCRCTPEPYRRNDE